MSTKHTPEPWGLKNAYPGTSLNYYQIFDADGDGVLGQDSVTMDEFSILEATAKRIVECVNAMEGIENPQLLRKSWDEQMFNEVKSNYVKTMLLSKEELQKLGEQYQNQEETPYIETSQPKDGPTKKDMEELLSYASKYEQLKEVIQNMVARLDEGSELTLTKDSIIVFCLKGAIQ